MPTVVSEGMSLVYQSFRDASVEFEGLCDTPLASKGDAWPCALSLSLTLLDAILVRRVPTEPDRALRVVLGGEDADPWTGESSFFCVESVSWGDSGAA